MTEEDFKKKEEGKKALSEMNRNVFSYCHCLPFYSIYHSFHFSVK